MLYVEIPDKIAGIQVHLENRHYTLAELVDIIGCHMDACGDSSDDDEYSDESDNEDCSDDDFPKRLFNNFLN